MKSLVIRGQHGVARADGHKYLGRVIAYVVRWELANGEGGSRIYPANGDGREARGFAWQTCIDASKGQPPRSVARTSWPVISTLVLRRAS